jgi:hypothetical protein
MRKRITKKRQEEEAERKSVEHRSFVDQTCCLDMQGTIKTVYNSGKHRTL